MIRYCRTLLNVFVLFLAVSLVPENVFACSCETYGQPRTDAGEYYTKKFNGAIFTGTIASIKHDPASDSGGITYSELTVDVDQYWLGVTDARTAILVPGPNTSCSVDWKLGEKGFFIASNVHGRLHYAACDIANWRPDNSETEIVDYTTNLLGKPKSFPKAKESRLQPPMPN